MKQKTKNTNGKGGKVLTDKEKLQLIKNGTVKKGKATKK